MKSYLTLLMVFFMSLSVDAQNFNIDPLIKDSLSSDNFFYHVKGVGDFSDSMVLRVELFNDADQSDVLFSGSYFFSGSQSEQLTDFSYNTVSKEFTFTIGSYPSNKMFLHMWIQDGVEIKNELFFK